MSIKITKILLASNLIISTSVAIKILQEVGSSVKEGDSLTIFCQVDVWYEWCTFRHNGNICDFEYSKYSVDEVEAINCADYADRVTFVGDYRQSECGITIEDATPEDAGEWTCEFEEYYIWDQRNYGDKVRGNVTVEVELTSSPSIPKSTPTSQELPFFPQNVFDR